VRANAVSIVPGQPAFTAYAFGGVFEGCIDSTLLRSLTRLPSGRAWELVRSEFGLGHIGRVPENHLPGSTLLHPQLGETHTDIDVVPGRSHDNATRPGDDSVSPWTRTPRSSSVSDLY
jgi:hypothetical protein